MAHWATSLYGRLVIVFVLLVLAFSLLFVILFLHNTRAHLEVVDQRNNRELAANILEVTRLTHASAISRADAKRIFHEVMAINPSIQVYLLDRDGKVIHYDAPPGSIERMQVDVSPITTFLKPSSTLPVHGDDPRHARDSKVFSVAPLGSSVHPTGYLYAILSNARYESMWELLGTNSVLRRNLIAALIGTALIATLGIIGLRHLTARLRVVTAAVNNFRHSGFRQPVDFTQRQPVHPGDDVGQMALAFRDMSNELAKHLDALNAQEERRRELIENFLHDFKTPLATLRMYLQALGDNHGELTASQQAVYRQRALNFGEKLDQLSTDLFELVRLDAQDITLSIQPFAYNELVMDVLERYAVRSATAGIELVANVPRDVRLIEADIGLVERLLTNLIDNAFNHAGDGAYVEVEVEYNPERVLTRVKDRGPGIDQCQLRQVFERFYRINSKAGSNGSGLGLAIARRIVELHQGQIEARNATDTGCVFEVSLPIAMRPSPSPATSGARDVEKLNTTAVPQRTS